MRFPTGCGKFALYKQEWHRVKFQRFARALRAKNRKKIQQEKLDLAITSVDLDPIAAQELYSPTFSLA